MEKLEMLKQKLSKKRKLAVGFSAFAVMLAPAISKVAQVAACEGLKQLNLVRYQDVLHNKMMFIMLDLEDKYLVRYGVKIPFEPKTFLENLQANKEAYGENFQYVYDVFESNFQYAEKEVMYMSNVQEQAIQIGVGAGVASFLLVAGIPTARYLLCKRKIKKLEKELGENKEIEMSA